jgi:hypothetical protein
LDFPAPRIRPYPVYSVVAENFQTMVELGTLNSRMKDYFDVIHLQRHFEFRSEDLQEAMRKTFQRRCRTDCRKDWMSRSGKRPRNRPSGLHSCEKTAFRLKATSEKSAVKSPHSHYP